MQKMAGSRRAAHRLIASCHSPSDDPPSPINDSAHAPGPFTPERHRHAGNRHRPDRQRRGRRQHASIPVADVQIACRSWADRLWPSARSAPCAPLLRLVPHGERDTEIANHRRRRRRQCQMPSLRNAAPRRRRMPRGVNRLLPERAEALALKRPSSPQRTSPPMKNCLSRLSTARVSTIPRRISRRSSDVSEARIASRRRNPSQASTISARACSNRLTADVPGVVSVEPVGRCDNVVEAPRELTPKGGAQRFNRRRISPAGEGFRHRFERDPCRRECEEETARPRTCQNASRALSVLRDPRNEPSEVDSIRMTTTQLLQHRSSSVAALTLVAACTSGYSVGCGHDGAPAAPATAAAAASLVLVNGRVWTGDPRRPDAEAVAISGDRISAVGSTAELKAQAANAEVVDLGGAFVAPGFIDSHMHFLTVGSAWLRCNCATPKRKTNSFARIEEFADTCRRALDLGRRLGPPDLGRRAAAKEWIDAVTPKSGVAQPARRPHGARELGGLGGRQVTSATRRMSRRRDRARCRGEPTGIFKDNAMGLVDAVPPPSDGATSDRRRDEVRGGTA